MTSNFFIFIPHDNRNHVIQSINQVLSEVWQDLIVIIRKSAVSVSDTAPDDQAEAYVILRNLNVQLTKIVLTLDHLSYRFPTPEERRPGIDTVQP